MAALQITAVICTLLALVTAFPQGQVGYPQQYQQPGNAVGNGPRQQEPGMPYNFQWAVKDEPHGNDYGHQESSDGRVISGSYRVALPDGRTQKVSYRVEGESGFVANVQYEGQQRFDPPARPQQPQANAQQPQAPQQTPQKQFQQYPTQTQTQAPKYNQAG